MIGIIERFQRKIQIIGGVRFSTRVVKKGSDCAAVTKIFVEMQQPQIFEFIMLKERKSVPRKDLGKVLSGAMYSPNFERTSVGYQDSLSETAQEAPTIVPQGDLR